MADDTRRAIIMKLREGKISTGELAEHLGITPQALSYHLSKLKKAEIIYETKYKNFIYYELNLSVLGELIVWLDALKGENEKEKKKNIACIPCGFAADNQYDFTDFSSGRNPCTLRSEFHGRPLRKQI